MGKIVYLLDDRNKTLYDEDSVPKHMKTREPDAATLLRLLENRLNLLGVTNIDWLYCAITIEPIRNPVFYPNKEGITVLYEKSKLNEWLNKKGGIGLDPTALSQKAKLTDYLVPTSEQLLDFVVKSSSIAREFFVDQYHDFKPEETQSVKEPLLPNSDLEKRSSHVERITPKRSRAALLFRSIFCCISPNSEQTKEKEPHAHPRPNYFPQ
ncbi:hypothetical protein [Legionella waltersii]|uniref:Uncharacterized protein n=1 Tax=Legionella waltersii TaxID=66969 RepID=A0A0W1A022_9GAMM|nr:hypothetical protein [Legionella waltersii]KTD74711.1 hypothetical protein Lwal_2752 [Legionella waltersii]SNU99988.1 Uncharacterised protein [Legionella waltersii]